MYENIKDLHAFPIHDNTVQVTLDSDLTIWSMGCLNNGINYWSSMIKRHRKDKECRYEATQNVSLSNKILNMIEAWWYNHRQQWTSIKIAVDGGLSVDYKDKNHSRQEDGFELLLDNEQMCRLYTMLLTYRGCVLQPSEDIVKQARGRHMDPEGSRINEFKKVAYIIEIIGKRLQDSRTDECEDCNDAVEYCPKCRQIFCPVDAFLQHCDLKHPGDTGMHGGLS